MRTASSMESCFSRVSLSRSGLLKSKATATPGSTPLTDTINMPLNERAPLEYVNSESLSIVNTRTSGQVRRNCKVRNTVSRISVALMPTARMPRLAICPAICSSCRSCNKVV